MYIEKCYRAKLNMSMRKKSNKSLESKKPSTADLWCIIYLILNNNYGDRILVTAETL